MLECCRWSGLAAAGGLCADSAVVDAATDVEVLPREEAGCTPSAAADAAVDQAVRLLVWLNGAVDIMFEGGWLCA